MKIAIALVFLTALSCISATTFLEESDIKVKDLNTDIIQVYSMVWSAKSYTTTGKEEKTFFFAVPFSFNSQMKVNTSAKSIHFDWTTIDKEPAHYKILKEEFAPQCQKSKWNEFIKFSSDLKSLDLSLNFTTDQYTVTRIKLYQNQTFRNIQIKVMDTQSKFKSSLYITFDLEKKTVSDANRESFIKFFKTNWPKADVVTE